MSKFYAVGSLVNYEGRTLLVKGQVGNKPSCVKCFFTKGNMKKAGLKPVSCYVHGMQCTASQRKDNRHVVFLQVK